jgi:hypothetical protein
VSSENEQAFDSRRLHHLAACLRPSAPSLCETPAACANHSMAGDLSGWANTACFVYSPASLSTMNR